MNRQINPDHCAEINGVMYMLEAVPGTPEWRVLRNGRQWRTFTSLMAAKGWFDHVIAHPGSDKPRIIVAGGSSAEFKAKLAAALNGGRK